MEYGSRASAVTEAATSSSISPTAIDEETLWQMSLRGNESVETGRYPERPGEPDCAYYMRTGLCRFGMSCRFNHPPNRNLAVAAARMKGGYPERVGQPECQVNSPIHSLSVIFSWYQSRSLTLFGLTGDGFQWNVY